jgi:acetyl esterase/lipase
MAMNPLAKTVLKALSDIQVDVKKHYRMERVLDRVLHPSLKLRYGIWNRKIITDGFSLPVRVFSPEQSRSKEVILFFHGGGWVSGDIESYTGVCASLAKNTGRRVMSVDYRLAPEHPFPCGLEDCYRATRELFLHSTPKETAGDRIILMGDSAGGNLAAAVSLMAVDRGEFRVGKQILLYPSTHNDHSESSPFRSIAENGKDFLLTSKKIQDYQDLYLQNKGDLNNPYFAPLLSDYLEGQPKTLLITAEYDPLRDEGEAYGEKLRKYGNDVSNYRINDALHGFFSFSSRFIQVKKCYQLINQFLEE